MQAFVVGHATHPDGRMALVLAAAQVDAQLAARRPAPLPTLGLVYLTDALAPQAEVLVTSDPGLSMRLLRTASSASRSTSTVK